MIYFLVLVVLLLSSSWVAIHIYLYNMRRQYHHIPSLPLPWSLTWYQGHMPELVAKIRAKPHQHRGVTLHDMAPDPECKLSITFLYIQNLVLIYDVPMVTKLLNDRKTFTKRPFFGIFNSMAGVRIGGKYSLPGDLGSDLWAAKRRVQDQAFNRGILKQNMDGMNYVNKLFLAHMDAKCGEGKVFDIKPDFQKSTSDAIAKCGFDWPNELIDKYNNMLNLAADASNYCMGLTIKDPIGFKLPWTYPEAKGNMRKYVIPIRSEIREYLLKNMDEARTKNNLIGQIVRSHDVSDVLTIDDIVDEFVMYFAAAMDTTTASLSVVVWYVVRYPEVHARIQEEVDRVYGDRDELAYEDLTKLVYLEMVIREGLRLNGPAPAIGKQMGENLAATVNGCHFPRGTKFHIFIDKIHKDPLYWHDPLAFNPDRFAPTNKILPYTFLAFSAGQRSCIGRHFAMLEMKSTLAMLFRNFNIANGNPGETELEMAGNYTAEPKKEVLVEMTRRRRTTKVVS